MNLEIPSSSPLTPAPISREQSTVNHVRVSSKYRDARPLPFELAQHVQVYLEESMFTQAIRLLSSIVTADASAPATRPVTVPSPAYLGLLSTLIVHPTVTTRAASQEKYEHANSALRLLRLLNETVGPVNAGFDKAFVFTKYDRHRSYTRRQQIETEHSESEGRPVTIPLADTDSIWSRAEDFWAVVGWVMNCSCFPSSTTHFARWKSWYVWLIFMLDVLGSDWHSHDQCNSTEETLIWQYIELAPGGNTRARRMLRAIFADGSTSSLNEFREIFRGELKSHKRQQNGTNDAAIIKKREADVDIDREIYGDYLDNNNNSDSLSEEEETAVGIIAAQNESLCNPDPRRRRSRTRTPVRSMSNQSLRSGFDNNTNHGTIVSPSSRSPTLGPSEAMILRLRLLLLLANVAAHPTLMSTNPTAFPVLDELVILFVEFIKPLPLPAFQAIILSHDLISASPFTQKTGLDHRNNYDINSNGTGQPGISPTPTDTNRKITSFLLLESLLQRTLESSAPRTVLTTLPVSSPNSSLPSSQHSTTSTPDPKTGPQYIPTLKDIATDYLPYAATKSDIVSNVRVSLSLEGLLRLASHSSGPSMSESQKQELKDAVAVGIKRRMERVQKGLGRGRRRKGKNEHGLGSGVVSEDDSGSGETIRNDKSDEWNALVDSGRRMRCIAGMI